MNRKRNAISRRVFLQTLSAVPIVATGLPGCVANSGSVVGNLETASEVRLRRRYVDGRFGQIHLVMTGEPAAFSTGKHPLMCFHPTAVSSDFYRDFMLDMGRDRFVIAMDTPGYGRSDRPPEPRPMSELAGAAADALDALGYGRRKLGKVDLIGYHTGVYIATELAILRPDLVRRLVLPGIPYYVGDELVEKFNQFAKPGDVSEDGAHIMEVWDFWVSNRSEGVPFERGAEHFVDHLQSSPHSWWAYHGVFSYAADQRLPMVTQPVLVPNTMSSLRENTQAAARLFPDVRIVDMPDIDRGIIDLGGRRIAEVSRRFLDQ